MDVLVSIVATLMISISVVLTVLIAVTTGFFTGRVPSGPDGMAIMGPVIAGALSWVLTLAAAWLCISRDGFGWIAQGPLTPLAGGWSALIVTLVVVGMAMAAVWGFWGWSEQRSSVGALWTVFVLPCVLLGLMLACAWVSPSNLLGLTLPLTCLAVPCVAASVVGLGAGAKALNAWVSQRAVEAEAIAAEARQRDAEWTRRSGLTERDRVVEDIESLPPATPFWNIGGMLLEVKDPEAGRLLIDRARQVENFSTELRSTIECPYPTLRGAAVEFIRRDERREPEWAGLITRAIDLLADDIRRRGVLRDPEREEDLSLEADRLAQAVRVYPQADFSAPLAGLRRAIESTPNSQFRDRALASLEAAAAR